MASCSCGRVRRPLPWVVSVLQPEKRRTMQRRAGARHTDHESGRPASQRKRSCWHDRERGHVRADLHGSTVGQAGNSKQQQGSGAPPVIFCGRVIRLTEGQVAGEPNRSAFGQRRRVLPRWVRVWQTPGRRPSLKRFARWPGRASLVHPPQWHSRGQARRRSAAVAAGGQPSGPVSASDPSSAGGPACGRPLAMPAVRAHWSTSLYLVTLPLDVFVAASAAPAWVADQQLVRCTKGGALAAVGRRRAGVASVALPTPHSSGSMKAKNAALLLTPHPERPSPLLWLRRLPHRLPTFLVPSSGTLVNGCPKEQPCL